MLFASRSGLSQLGASSWCTSIWTLPLHRFFRGKMNQIPSSTTHTRDILLNWNQVKSMKYSQIWWTTALGHESRNTIEHTSSLTRLESSSCQHCRHATRALLGRQTQRREALVILGRGSLQALRGIAARAKMVKRCGIIIKHKFLLSFCLTIGTTKLLVHRTCHEQTWSSPICCEDLNFSKHQAASAANSTSGTGGTSSTEKNDDNW